MMTTLRSDRRTRRNATFHLEYLDDRIVLSAAAAVAAAEAHVAVAVSSGNTKAAEMATVTLERDETRLATVEAKEAAKVARFDARHHITPTSPNLSPIPIIVNTSGSASPTAASAPAVSASVVVSAPATVSSTVTSSPTVSTAINSSGASVTTATPVGSSSSAAVSPTVPVPTPVTTLPVNVGAALQSLYAQYESYESAGGTGTFTPTGTNGLEISGTDVGINFQTSDSADFNTDLSQLQSDGLSVTSDSATYGIIDGTLPIAQLAAIAQISSTASVTGLMQPIMN